MPGRPLDEERAERIAMQIIVDAYGPEEQALGWYTHLESNLSFPFLGRCIAERLTSPLRIGDEVDVLGMAPEDECDHEMFVIMRWEQRELAVPLAQLAAIAGDEDTRQAVEDWAYCVGLGHDWS